MPTESLAVEVDKGIVRVTLLGPGKGNALGPAFWDEAPGVFAGLDSDTSVRAIVIAGSGRHFCTGLDFAAMDIAASLRYVAAWNAAFLPSKDHVEAIAAMFQPRIPVFTSE
jgi:enoyl-CoA hydratase